MSQPQTDNLSALERLYGRQLSVEEKDSASENLTRFLKLLVRIDRRIKREEANANH